MVLIQNTEYSAYPILPFTCSVGDRVLVLFPQGDDKKYILSNKGASINADKLNSHESSYFATSAQGTKADNALPASTYTASDILAKLKTVDTDTSGLNANTLQGSTLAQIISEIKLAEHPIGDLIFNTSGTNPGTYIGGTWIAWGSGKVPVGVDTSQTEFNTVEKTSGSKTQSYTLTEGFAKFNPKNGTANATFVKKTVAPYTIDGYLAGVNFTEYSGGGTTSDAIALGGATDSGNNLQPSVTCYMWKRVS